MVTEQDKRFLRHPLLHQVMVVFREGLPERHGPDPLDFFLRTWKCRNIVDTMTGVDAVSASFDRPAFLHIDGHRPSFHGGRANNG